MSRLPPPNWDHPPFNHYGFMEGHRMPRNLLDGRSLRSPHFMPSPPMGSFCSRPPYNPHMMHNVLPPRPTWEPSPRPSHMAQERTTAPATPETPDEMAKWREQRKRNYPSGANGLKRQGQQMLEKPAVQIKLDNPEEIAKWREERRRNYPSGANGLKKQGQQMLEKPAVQIKLDNPEEIAKWREERRRNYPTVANVKKKEEKEGQRQSSGQVLGTTNYKYRRQRGGRFQRSSRRFKGNRARPPSRQGPVQPADTAKTATEETGAVDGDPLSLLLAGGACDDSDSETARPVQAAAPDSLPTSSSAPAPAAPSPTSALGSLCAYGDMSSDDNDEDKEAAMEVNNNNKNNLREEKEQPSKQGKDNSRIGTKQRKGPTKGRRNQKRKGKHLARTQSNQRPTLLQMLLAPEVRHERNVILQCLRYIVKKNFFGC